jgi:plastocyanin
MIRRLTVLLCSAAIGAAWAFAPAASHTVGSSSTRSSLTVHMKGSAFQPQSADVKVGQTVIFTNDDEVTHNVTEPDKGINSGDITAGKSWQYKFSKPGAYSYVCTYHPGMKGQITVTRAK